MELSCYMITCKKPPAFADGFKNAFDYALSTKPDFRQEVHTYIF